TGVQTCALPILPEAGQLFRRNDGFATGSAHATRRQFFLRQYRYFARPRIQRYDSKISLSIEGRQSNRIGPDSSIARALRIALGSSHDLHFGSGRLRVRLQILRKRAGWLETKSASG